MFRYKTKYRGWLLGALALVFLLSACEAVQVTEVPFASAGEQYIGSVEEETYINILGVDFDPPLDYLDDVRAQGVTLLVALENRGSFPVRDVRVVARLYLEGMTDGRPWLPNLSRVK